MPPALFRSPFPPLHLTLDEREHLYSTANTLVDEAQTLYEDYLFQNHCIIDAAKWSHVKTRDNMRVYHDRRPGGGTTNKNMHLLLTVGTVVGSLHDAMYGVDAHTTNDMRIKTAYVADTVLDCAVLATIVEPSTTDPFQSLTVRWVLKGIPFYIRPLVKHPDAVYLEATGFRQLSNGERIGYQLIHSVAFATTPILPNYDRVNLSWCTIWRQASPERVEAFMTWYLEIKDSVVVPLFIKSCAETSVSIGKVIECAQLKKLSYLVNTNSIRGDSQSSDGCVVCESHSSSATDGAKSACAICGNAVCKKCRIKRELAFFAPDGDLLRRKMRYCVSCFMSAGQLDAYEVAQARITARDMKRRTHIVHEDTNSLTLSPTSTAPFF